MKEHKKLVRPDYENCIANLPNSILKKWNIPTVGETLSLADKYLQKDYKNVVVLILDGMGKSILEGTLDENGPFRSHLVIGESQLRLNAPASTGVGLRNIRRQYLDLSERPVVVEQTDTEFRVQLPLL